MEKEILEQYNKVKDILSEEEFLAEMEEIRPNYNDLPFINDADIAADVVKNHIGASDISSSKNSAGENDDSSFEEVVMTDELFKKYEEVKEFLSQEEFLAKMKLKWSTIKQVLQIVATIITTVLGTIAVQSCSPHLF